MEIKNYFWLSFVDPDINKNLGCTIIEDASNLNEAISKAHSLNINPGGEVLGTPLNEEQFEEQGMESNKLYTPKELDEMKFKKIYE